MSLKLQPCKVFCACNSKFNYNPEVQRGWEEFIDHSEAYLINVLIKQKSL